MTREEAIEIINRENNPNNKEVWEVFPEYREALDMAIKALQQEPKTAYWIETDSDDSCYYMCSECHRRTDDKSDYCPNCGRRMVEPQESEG